MVLASFSLFPVFCLGQVRVDVFCFKGEFVVEKLVEKHLGDDFEFVSVVAQAIRGTDALEAVD